MKITYTYTSYTSYTSYHNKKIKKIKKKIRIYVKTLNRTLIFKHPTKNTYLACKIQKQDENEECLIQEYLTCQKWKSFKENKKQRKMNFFQCKSTFVGGYGRIILNRHSRKIHELLLN